MNRNLSHPHYFVPNLERTLGKGRGFLQIVDWKIKNLDYFVTLIAIGSTGSYFEHNGELLQDASGRTMPLHAVDRTISCLRKLGESQTAFIAWLELLRLQPKPCSDPRL